MNQPRLPYWLMKQYFSNDLELRDLPEKHSSHQMIYVEIPDEDLIFVRIHNDN